MLDSHTDIVGSPEFLHIPEIVRLGDHMVESVERGWIDQYCSSQDVSETIKGLIRHFLIPYLDRVGGKLLSEKTPANVLVFDRLLELFPRARFIHVVRDPRATVASLLEVGRRARAAGETPVPYAADVAAAASYVRKCLKAGLAAQDLVPERVYRIHYERLVCRPVDEGRALCAFLGVPWQERMASPGEVEHPGAAAITDNSSSIWYDRDEYYANPHTASLERWRETLAIHQRIAIRREFAKRDELERLGYDLSDPLGSALVRFCGHVRDLQVRAQRRVLRSVMSGG